MRVSITGMPFIGAIAAAWALCALAGGDVLHAQSISDLDLGGLESLSASHEVRSHVNPFTKGVSAAEDLAVEDLQLTGIVFRDDDTAYALISGYLVSPGDKIAGFRVDKIEKNRVRLKRLDEIIVLALGGGI